MLRRLQCVGVFACLVTLLALCLLLAYGFDAAGDSLSAAFSGILI